MGVTCTGVQQMVIIYGEQNLSSIINDNNNNNNNVADKPKAFYNGITEVVRPAGWR